MALNSTQLSCHALPVLWMMPFFTQCWITDRYHQSKKTQFHMLRVTHQKTNDLEKQPPLVSHSEHMRLCLFRPMVSVSYPVLIVNTIFPKSQLTFVLTRIHKIHTHPFNGPLSGATRVSRYQKGETNLDLLKQETVSGSGISWAICKSAPRSRQITTPAPHRSVVYRPNALPAAQQCQSTEGEVN